MIFSFLSGKQASASLWISIITLAIALGGSVARADDLYLGGGFNVFNFYVNNADTTLGGGSVQNVTWNGEALAFMYCVDLFDDIYVPGDYNQTSTTNNAVVNGSLVNNAGQVAWLVSQYAIPAEDNANAQIALQSSIWHVMYGAGYYLDPTSAAYGLYTADLAALGTNTASVSPYDWFTPGSSSGGGQLQAQVGALANSPNGNGDQETAPEPASVLLLGTVLLGVLTGMKRGATGESRRSSRSYRG